MSLRRWDEIAEHLRTRIRTGSLRPGDRLPAESALAEEWQVCRMTAHRVLSELSREGLVVRRRRVGTVVTGPEAASMASETTTVRHVALLFFHTNDFPQVEYIAGFRSGLSDRHHVLLCDTGNDPGSEAAYLQRFLTEADAVCCYPSCAPENTPPLQRLIAAGKPVICLDRIPAGLDADAIVTDNLGSTREALQRLCALGGHRRIAFLTKDEPEVSSVQERMEAYQETLSRAGVTNAERYIRRYPPRSGYDFDAFAAAIRSDLAVMLAAPEPPTAVFCLEDYFLAAVVEACADLHLAIPDDLAVIGFNDCPPMLPRPERRIHRITQCAWEMGRIAAERLEQRLNGAETGSASVIRRVPARIQFAGERYAASAASSITKERQIL